MARRRGPEFREAEGPAGSDEVPMWRRLVAEQLASGLSQDAFCEQRRVSPWRFRYWKYTRLAVRRAGEEGRTESPTAPVSLVPVRVVQGCRSEPRHARSGGAGTSGVEILLPGGLRVSLQRGFDSSVLREVVEVLGC